MSARVLRLLIRPPVTDVEVSERSSRRATIISRVQTEQAIRLVYVGSNDNMEDASDFVLRPSSFDQSLKSRWALLGSQLWTEKSEYSVCILTALLYHGRRIEDGLGSIVLVSITSHMLLLGYAVARAFPFDR